MRGNLRGACGLLLLLAAHGAAAQPVCSARASLDPPRAVVGQQVLYAVEIASREDVASVEWVRRPAFADARVEPLPGVPLPARPSPDGTQYRLRQERVVLFPERVGVQTLRAQGLRCVLPSGVVHPVNVPEIVLDVEAFPEPVPPDFSGLVGPLVVLRTVVPREVSLGETLRVAVMMRGGGNLWDAPAPYSEAGLGSAEVFERRPELALDRGTLLSVRRNFVWDVVPRVEGTLVVPPLRVTYYDPARGVYAYTLDEAVDVRVGPRLVAESDSARPARAESEDTTARRPAKSPVPGTTVWAAALALIGVACAAGGFLLWRRRQPNASAALASARAARDEGDASAEAAALTRAVRAALSRHFEDARSASPEEMLRRDDVAPAVTAAVHLLADLERARFDPTGPGADSRAVERAIADLD